MVSLTRNIFVILCIILSASVQLHVKAEDEVKSLGLQQSLTTEYRNFPVLEQLLQLPHPSEELSQALPGMFNELFSFLKTKNLASQISHETFCAVLERLTPNNFQLKEEDKNLIVPLYICWYLIHQNYDPVQKEDSWSAIKHAVIRSLVAEKERFSLDSKLDGLLSSSTENYKGLENTYFSVYKDFTTQLSKDDLQALQKFCPNSSFAQKLKNKSTRSNK